MGKDSHHGSQPFEGAEPDCTGKRVDQRAYATGATIFVQGDPCTGVLYLSTGIVRLSVVSQAGKEAIFAVLTTGQFFGEACLAGQPRRTATATAMSDCTVTTIAGQEMKQRLKTDPTFADRVFADMLDRHMRLEEDLIDQLFNSTEKRLARTLLLLARLSQSKSVARRLPRVSQELLAEMIGTTRTRVNFFMNKFRKLGLIEYDHEGLTVNHSLRGVVLRD